jgi:glycerate 2-kinase
MTENNTVAQGQRDRMRADAEAIFRAGLGAADPSVAMARMCHRENGHLRIDRQVFDLATVDRIWVVGAGKASANMARTLEALLADRIDGGLISVKYGHGLSLTRIEVIEAGHPLPDDNGVRAAGRILDMVTHAQSSDLIIGLFSGGGSALLPLPVQGITLHDKQATTDLLLACGATIHEINAIRKHLSAVKGGRLAQAAAPATMLSLILSDVVGDNLDVIASGATVPDSTTFGDCLDILERYGIDEKVPSRIRSHLHAGAAGRQDETPKQHTHAWQRVHNLIVGSNSIALQAAAQEAQSRGYTPLVLSAQIEGETRTAAQVHAAIARQVAATGQPIRPPACILSGGETTVTLKGRGKGGRNQEFALSAALAISGRGPIVILSAGTDGTDGPTDAAGAFADDTTVKRSIQAGLDIRKHLTDNNAYPFFKALGDLLLTGPTGTNVMDLNVMLIQAP